VRHRRVLALALLAAVVAVPVAGARQQSPRALGTATLTGASNWHIGSCAATFCPGGPRIQPHGRLTGPFGKGAYLGFLDDGAAVSCATGPTCAAVTGGIMFAFHRCLLFTSAKGTAGLDNSAGSESRAFTLNLTIVAASRTCPVQSGTLQLTYTAVYQHDVVDGVPTVSFSDTGTLTG